MNAEWLDRADGEPDAGKDGLPGIADGLADVETGRVTALEDFEAEFRARNGLAKLNR